jgi:hypothetical protein
VQRQNLILSNFCQNNEELSIIKAVFSGNTITHDTLIDELAKWRWMVGIGSPNQTDDEVAQELVLLSKFVKSNYINLTIEEISLAIELSLTNKLLCEIKPYGSFSPMYVSNILNAYLDYKRKLHNEISERKLIVDNKDNVTKEITPHDKMESMIELLIYLYNDYKEKGIVNDYFNTLYNYLRRTNRINPSKEIVDNAMIYAREQTMNHINSYFGNALNSEKPNKEYIEKRFARNYCVQLYFDDINIDDLIPTININEFQ